MTKLEDVFGILKKRFTCLKHWTLLNQQETIDNMFVTCCVLHNLQLIHDGYLDENLADPVDSALNRYRFKNRGPGCWRRNWEDHAINERLERVQKAIGASEEKKWAHRMRILVNHFSVHMGKKKHAAAVGH